MALSVKVLNSVLLPLLEVATGMQRKSAEQCCKRVVLLLEAGGREAHDFDAEMIRHKPNHLPQIWMSPMNARLCQS